MPNVGQNPDITLHDEVVEMARRLYPFSVPEALIQDALAMVASMGMGMSDAPPIMTAPTSWDAAKTDAVPAATPPKIAHETAYHDYIVALARICGLLTEAWSAAGQAEEALVRLAELNTVIGGGEV